MGDAQYVVNKKPSKEMVGKDDYQLIIVMKQIKFVDFFVRAATS